VEYEAIMASGGSVRPFNNIIRAEGQHAAWLADLFRAHGLAVAVDTPAAEPLPADVKVVFERLERASENHLRAFRTNLARYQ
jgi:hypothetical protein